MYQAHMIVTHRYFSRSAGIGWQNPTLKNRQVPGAHTVQTNIICPCFRQANILLLKRHKNAIDRTGTIEQNDDAQKVQKCIYGVLSPKQPNIE